LLRKEIPVGGRLKEFREFWTLHVQDQWALNVIQTGYQIEFVTLPPWRGIKTTKLNNKQQFQLLQSEIEDLLLKNAIEKVPLDQINQGFYSTFFLVPKKTGDLRPVLNLSPLNAYLERIPFKMETIGTVIKAVQSDDWMITLDL
jgi:hypothetical protein